MVGTFIVRSGLITSVHAFATDPNRGIFILTLISIYIVASLSVFALRPIKADGFLKYRIFSKDFFLILNNLLLMTAVFTVFVGTVYPMVLEIFSGERISVGTPFYTITVIPIIFLISIFAPVAVFLPWGNLEVKKQYKKYITPYLLIILSSWAVCFYMDIKSIMSFIGVFVSFWIISMSFNMMSDLTCREVRSNCVKIVSYVCVKYIQFFRTVEAVRRGGMGYGR